MTIGISVKCEETFSQLMGVHTAAAIMKIRVKFLLKASNRSTIEYNYTTLLNILPKNCIPYYRDICSSMIVVALPTISRKQKQPGCLSAEEWITKIWSVYTVGKSRKFAGGVGNKSCGMRYPRLQTESLHIFFHCGCQMRTFRFLCLIWNRTLSQMKQKI